MSPILYAINISTLATWLSVAGFGTVGIVIPMAGNLLKTSDSALDPYRDLESTLMLEDFTPEMPPSTETDSGEPAEAEIAAEAPAEPETLPTPPEMPEVTDVTPLPEIPELSSPAPQPQESVAPVKPKVLPKSAPAVRSVAATTQGKPTTAAKPATGGSNSGTGMSDAKRLASGRMPPPSYPSDARAKGQTGTVVVEFVVGENGAVVSAYSKSASPWPSLNERAVSTVRRWKFPPGRVTKYVRPITFKLN